MEQSNCLLGSGSGDGTVILWDVETGSQPRSSEGHANLVDSVDFSPDGSTLATGLWEGTVGLSGIPGPDSRGVPPGELMAAIRMRRC